MTKTRDTHRIEAADRFAVPLYTVAEAANYLDVPSSTLRSWTHGYSKRLGNRTVRGAPVLTTIPQKHRLEPVIPFVGLAEGLVLSAIRKSGVPLQRIRPALERLDTEFGLKHALASKRLYTDGAEVLFDYAIGTHAGQDREIPQDLAVVRNGQRVFKEIISSYLKRVQFDTDGYVRLIRLPAYDIADVVVDPDRGFGQPIFARGGARVEDVLSMFRAGERLEDVAEEFSVPQLELEDAVRVVVRNAV